MDTRKVVKMVYRDYKTLTPAYAGALAYHVYRCNSIFDPDYTAAGHQPSGHDQWANLYDMYTVIGAKFTAQFCNLVDVGSAYPTMAFVYIDDDLSAPSTDWRTVLECNKFSKSRLCSWDGTKPTLTINFSTKKFFSRSPKDDSLTAQFGTNPSEEAFFVLGAQPYEQSSGTAGVAVVIKITYIVLMSEPKTIAAS